MLKGIKLRAAIAIVVCLTGLFFLTPSLTVDLPDMWKKYLPMDKIHLGLDLQGGTHLVLEVDTEKAVESTIDRMTNDIKETLMTNKVRFLYLEGTKRREPYPLNFPTAPQRRHLKKS